MVPNQTSSNRTSPNQASLDQTRPAVKLDPPQREWVETIGLFLERSGFPPSSARIYGLLLMSAEPELSFEDLVSTLGFGKAAVSTGLRRLQETNRISERTRPGERRRYFRARLGPDVGVDRFRAFSSALCDLLEEGVALRGNSADAEVTADLEASVRFLRFLDVELGGLRARWEADRDG